MSGSLAPWVRARDGAGCQCGDGGCACQDRTVLGTVSPFTMPELECRECGKPESEKHTYCDPMMEWLHNFVMRLLGRTP